MAQDLIDGERGKNADLPHGTVRVDARSESKAAGCIDPTISWPRFLTSTALRFYLSSASPTCASQFTAYMPSCSQKQKRTSVHTVAISAQKSPQEPVPVPAVAWNQFGCMGPKHRVLAALLGLCAPTMPGSCIADCLAVAQVSHRIRMDAQTNAVCTGWYALQTPLCQPHLTGAKSHQPCLQPVIAVAASLRISIHLDRMAALHYLKGFDEHASCSERPFSATCHPGLSQAHSISGTVLLLAW